MASAELTRAVLTLISLAGVASYGTAARTATVRMEGPSQLPLNPYMKKIVSAVGDAVANIDEGGQEAYGDWIQDAERSRLLECFRGLRAWGW